MLLFSILACTSGDKPIQVEPQEDLLGILISPEQVILSVGQEVQLTATGLQSNHDSIDLTESVEWMVEYYDVLDISENLDSEGVLTALSAGSSRIYAQYNTLRSPYADVIVTSAELENITINPSDLVLTEGDQVQLQAFGTFSNGDSGDLTQQVRWITGNSAIIQFEINGIIEAVNAGSTTVHASYEGLESDPIEVEVNPYVENGRPDLIIEEISSLVQNDEVIISTTITNQGSNGASGFWLDLFIGEEEPSFNEIGDAFFWLEYLGPNRGTTIETPLPIQGSTTVWAIVDTTKIIDESHENNNKESITISATNRKNIMGNDSFQQDQAKPEVGTQER